MNKTQGHDPAYPTDIWVESRNGGFSQEGCDPGLTKRELIAAMAMQGILSNQSESERDFKNSQHSEFVQCKTRAEFICLSAVRMADNLLSALASPTPQNNKK